MTFFWFVKHENRRAAAAVHPTLPQFSNFLSKYWTRKVWSGWGADGRKGWSQQAHMQPSSRGLLCILRREQAPGWHCNMLAHVPAQSPNQQHPCCPLTFCSLLQQAAALQFSLQVTHTSQIHQGSTLLFHRLRDEKMKCWVFVPFPLSHY